MKRGFTLVELMVVVGIMAFLGVAATSGYNALQRGMAERGATAAASSLLSAAKERAMVDRVPTMVFCYNRMLREATDDENAVIVGEAVAIRRAGRVTWADSKYIVDEFMDVLGSYDIVSRSDVQQRKGMKLWRFDDQQMNDMQYSVVADAVTPLDRTTLNLYTFGAWVTGETSANSNLHYVAYAFYDLGTSSHAPSAWVAGNGYGFEFASMQLPKNFIFEKLVPTRLGDVRLAKALYFTPDLPNTDKDVNVYRCVPKASGVPEPGDRPAGVASSKENQKI